MLMLSHYPFVATPLAQDASFALVSAAPIWPVVRFTNGEELVMYPEVEFVLCLMFSTLCSLLSALYSLLQR
jgi:hypothetical protein